MTFDRLSEPERAAMADRLKAARYRAGLTVRGVAHALDVNANSVIAWEHGALPGTDKREKLAVLYGVDEDTLFAEVAARRAHAEDLLRPA
jgi:transcriptional regulator with XRE-family HTH domain